MTKQASWFEVGYDEGFAGKDERVPEAYHSRTNYRRGWAQGDADRRLAATGHAIVGRKDLALAG